MRKLAERLKAAGLRVWLDEWNVKPGTNIYSAIQDGLERSRSLVLCMSQAAFGAAWVELESGAAIFRDPANKQRRFIPLLLEDCTIPDTVRQFSYVDWRSECDSEYRKLLVALREPVDVAETLDTNTDARKTEAKSAGLALPTGMALAAAQFLARTCQLGIFEDRMFLPTGVACYVGKNTLITAGETMDLTTDVLVSRPGRVGVLTTFGPASVQENERCEWGNISVLKATDVDTSRFEASAKTMDLHGMSPLDHSPIRARKFPCIGEPVGFLNAPVWPERVGAVNLFPFEQAAVSYIQKDDPFTMHNHVLTPILSRVPLTGSPVFGEDGCLVGVIRDSFQCEDESCHRLVMANLLQVDCLQFASEEGIGRGPAQ